MKLRSTSGIWSILRASCRFCSDFALNSASKTFENIRSDGLTVIGKFRTIEIIYAGVEISSAYKHTLLRKFENSKKHYCDSLTKSLHFA